MNKHVIIGVFGSSDSPQIEIKPDENAIQFPLISGNSILNHGITGVLDDLVSMNVYPTEVALDLLVVAVHVYATDTRISRKNESQDSWTRELKLIIPVSNLPIWDNVKASLTKLLNFLTGDIWDINFRERPQEFLNIIPSKEDIIPDPVYDKVQLFSGGLDSLIGTIDNLEKGYKPLLISHAGDGPTSKAQTLCFSALKNYYPQQEFDRLRLWMNISSQTFAGIKAEDTTRGRSFLFFALGVFAGSGLKQPFILETPENGLIALNVPLNLLRLGALSTHTTHPFYMNLWNKILKELNISGEIQNLYWDKTKGKMVQDCLNKSLLQTLLPDSLSCSSPAKGRWRGKIGHCGYCLPCLIRRAAVLSEQSIQDNTFYALSNLTASKIETLKADGKQIRSFQAAIRKLKGNNKLAKLQIHKSGPLPKDASTLILLENVYINGMMEVDKLLTNVITEPSKKV